MSTLANAHDVLKLIALKQSDLTVSEVAEGLGQPKSSISRTLSQMAEYGFLERDQVSRAYRPGPLITEASHHLRLTRSVVPLLEAELTSVVEEFGYTGYVVMLDGAESLVLHMRAGKVGTLQFYTPTGMRAPAYATSMGRATLARLDNAQVLQRVGSNVQQVGGSPASVEELLESLAIVRRQGWSASTGEWVRGVAGVASAVVDDVSADVIGIGLAYPDIDIDEDLVARLGLAVRDAARRVGRIVGDTYWLNFSDDPA